MPALKKTGLMPLYKSEKPLSVFLPKTAEVAMLYCNGS